MDTFTVAFALSEVRRSHITGIAALCAEPILFPEAPWPLRAAHRASTGAELVQVAQAIIKVFAGCMSVAGPALAAASAQGMAQIDRFSEWKFYRCAECFGLTGRALAICMRRINRNRARARSPRRRARRARTAATSARGSPDPEPPPPLHKFHGKRRARPTAGPAIDHPRPAAPNMEGAR